MTKWGVGPPTAMVLAEQTSFASALLESSEIPDLHPLAKARLQRALTQCHISDSRRNVLVSLTTAATLATSVLLGGTTLAIASVWAGEAKSENWGGAFLVGVLETFIFFILISIVLAGASAVFDEEWRDEVLGGFIPLATLLMDSDGSLFLSPLRRWFNRIYGIALTALFGLGGSWALLTIAMENGWAYVASRIATIVAAGACASIIINALCRQIDRSIGDPVAGLLRNLAVCLARAADLAEQNWTYSSIDSRNRELTTSLWTTEDAARCDLARRLLRSAAETDYYFRHSAGIYRLMRTDQAGPRIAAGFREHARIVLLGGCDADSRLAPALTCGLAAALHGDWHELCRTEPPPPIETFLARWARPIALAAVLLAGALALPRVFQMTDEYANSLRALLLSAALISLTRSPRDAVLKVGEEIASSGKDDKDA